MNYQQKMNEPWFNKNTIQVIPEQSDRLFSQQCIRSCQEQSNNSFQLLLKAHDRIRFLEGQNQELKEQLQHFKEANAINSQLIETVQKMKEEIVQKNLKIDNLQKINQRAIVDYVKLERQIYLQKKQKKMCRNLTALPNELNSPLHPIIRTDTQNSRIFQSIENKPRNLSAGRQIARRKDKLCIDLGENREENRAVQFTFDGGLKKQKSQGDNKHKHYCSVAQMSGLVNKIQQRQSTSHLNAQKTKLKEYRNYCSSIQKKYSPGVSLKKQNIACKQTYPLSIKKCSSPRNFQFRNSMGKWQMNSTNSTQTGAFAVWSKDKYTLS